MTHRLTLVAAALIAVVATGCSAAASPTTPAASSPSPAGSAPPSSILATLSPATTPLSTTPPTPEPSPTGPPAARLDGLHAGVTAAGSLASWTWDGAGGDGMWVVRPPLDTVRTGSSLRVVIDGAPATTRWQAQWAATQGAAVGSPIPGGSGESEPIAVQAPGPAGPWSLAVTASFGTGRSATWTWQVQVSP